MLEILLILGAAMVAGVGYGVKYVHQHDKDANNKQTIINYITSSPTSNKKKEKKREKQVQEAFQHYIGRHCDKNDKNSVYCTCFQKHYRDFFHGLGNTQCKFFEKSGKKNVPTVNKRLLKACNLSIGSMINSQSPKEIPCLYKMLCQKSHPCKSVLPSMCYKAGGT